MLASRNDGEGALRVLRQGVASDPRNPRVHARLSAKLQRVMGQLGAVRQARATVAGMAGVGPNFAMRRPLAFR